MSGDVRVDIREIEQQQIVRSIVVREQYHEHILQVQHQHQLMEIRHGVIRQHEHYEHVSGDVRVDIREIEQQQIVRSIVVHEQHHEHILQVQHQHQLMEIRHGHIRRLIDIEVVHYEHVSGDVRVDIREIEQQQIVRSIVVHEQHHEHIQQVQH